MASATVAGEAAEPATPTWSRPPRPWSTATVGAAGAAAGTTTGSGVVASPGMTGTLPVNDAARPGGSGPWAGPDETEVDRPRGQLMPTKVPTQKTAATTAKAHLRPN